MAKAGPRAKLSAAEIEAQMPSHNPNAAVMLDRVLRRSLSSAGDDRRLQRLAPVAKYVLRA